MTGEELRRRREAIPMTHAELGRMIGESAERIELWEETSRLMGKVVKRLEWAMALGAREKALVAAGHPPCAEAAAIFGEPENQEEFARKAKLAGEHGKACDHCQRRDAYDRSLGPLPPMPLPGLVGIMVQLHQWISKLPPFLRPGAWGALAFGAMTAFKAGLMTVLRPSQSLRAWGMALGAIAIGGFMGAVGGIAWSLIRPVALKLGRAGDFLAAVVAVNACLLSALLPIRLFKMDGVSHTWAFVVTMLVLGTVVGVFLGRSTLRLTPEPNTDLDPVSAS